jgi:hypothetical protein
MFDALPKGTPQRLWPHQAKALDFAIKHLNRFPTPCLIRMPTGTGKTGVIACLTALSNPGSSLVLTPWAHLRRQLIDDVAQDFWNNRGLPIPKVDVVPLMPSTAHLALRAGRRQIMVATFATLNDLRLDHANIYEDLAKAVSLVVVDEGHYEPAVEWGKSVKRLSVKTVLLTATPYRNDLKLFRIADPDSSTYHFTHEQAVAKGIIRKVRFEELASPTDMKSLSLAFAKTWKAKAKAKSLPSAAARAIICCSDDEDIATVVATLRGQGLKALGVHEQFGDPKTPELLKEVPEPGIADAEIWVHQHKLTEGLDDHRFCCVALFTRIRNDRKLIQQIGRTLRSDNADRDAPALVLAPSKFSAEDEWNAYLEFETQFQLLKPEHFRDVVNSLLASQPPVEYFGGRFRRSFNPAGLSVDPQVIVSPSVLVRVAGIGFSLDDYIQDCTDTLNIKDAVILGPDINAPCNRSATFALWVYASVGNSRSLQSASLYEIKLETHCVVLAGGFVLMTDSRGYFPDEYLEDYTSGIPAASQLTRFLDKSFRMTNVSVNSSIPYDTVLRGADQRGHNLLGVAASLTDRIHICRAARGRSDDLGGRYIGMSNGRLRKEMTAEDRRTFELDAFVDWAAETAAILNSNVGASEIFDRYMSTCAPPPNPTPRTLCVDLLRKDIRLALSDGREVTLESSSADIEEAASNNGQTYTCQFDVKGPKIRAGKLALRIEYQPTRRRFWFHKEDGLAVHVTVANDDESPSKGFAEFLNQKQDVILIGLEGGTVVYQGRNFYKVDYSYAERVLLGLIERPTGAPDCRTEKGTKDEIRAAKRIKAKRFLDGSLFQAVAEHRVGIPFTDEALICADMGTECADFVAASFSARQLALIHAKADAGRRISAKAFHDVVAQAMKNLVYLGRNEEVPKGVASWRPGVTWNKTGVDKVCRLAKGLPIGQAFWNKVQSDIVGSSHPELYVVLLTTGCCDLGALKDAIVDPSKRTHETAQLFHLLDGLNGYARQLGVRLRVYDVPYKPKPKTTKGKTSST